MSRRGYGRCSLCGRLWNSGNCAHECPHGQPCTFLGHAGGQVDFSRRMCGECDRERDPLKDAHSHPRLGLTRRPGLLPDDEIEGLTLALTMLAMDLARSA